MSRLIVLTGPDTGRDFRLKNTEQTIGRHESCDIVLTDPQVSRKHGTVVAHDGHLTVTDLGSGNGTIVGGVKVSQARMQSGERFLLGDTTLLFLTKDATPPGIVRTLPGDAGSVLLSQPATATTDWLRQRLTHLGVLYEANRATTEINDLDELLGKLLDLALRTTGADCGSIYLNDDSSGEWLPHVERTGEGQRIAISRTILEYVKREQLGVLATDAGLDERFVGGESIARHGIRAVIAVPMKGRHAPVGAIVLETLADGRAQFTDDHLSLAATLAHQAALVVEENRYYTAMLNAGKLAAVGQAMASLSHHIKNIMHGVRFGSDLVKQGLKTDDREILVKGWSIVEKNQDRIDGLIRNMLDFSKDREPLRATTDLVKLVRDVAEGMKARADAVDVLIDVVTPDSLSANCDSYGIHQALLNLVTNAVDAAGDVGGGRVTVELTSTETDVILRVRDTGPGIDAKDAESIFEPFVSKKGSRGTGLGLPVSRKTLREHGGTLTLEPQTPGACFTMQWPIDKKGSG